MARRRLGGSSSKTVGRKFKYHKRSYEELQKSQQQSGGGFDSLFKEDLTVLKIGNKKSISIRFLPALWIDEPHHYGIEFYVHSKIGPGKFGSQYVCLKETYNKPCSICEDMEEAGDDFEYIKTLKPQKRFAAYVIDRDDEKEGIQILNMPWTLDKAIALVSADERTQEVFAIDDPDEGFDVYFTTEKKGDYTNFIGHKIARRESPLMDDSNLQDEFLAYVQEHPILEHLEQHSYEHIKNVHCGNKDKEEEKPEKEEKEEKGNADVTDSKPPNEEEKAPELTWDYVHSLKPDDLDILATSDMVGMTDSDLDELEHDEAIQDNICEILDIKKEEKKETKVKSRLVKLRGRNKK